MPSHLNTPKALSPEEQKEATKQEELLEWQKAGKAGGAALADLNEVAYGSIYTPAPPNTSIAFSGSDCKAYIVTYGAISRSSFSPVPNLAAISYSIHRDKAPVRRLGDYIAREYTKGSRTIAGTIVLINFDRAAFYEMLHGTDIYGQYGTQVGLADEIPPFDVMLMFSEENKGRRSAQFPSKIPTIGKGTDVGEYSHMWIRGVRLVDEGAVTGTDEDYMETSFQYVAEHIDYLKPNNVIQDTSAIAQIQQDLSKAVSASPMSPVPAEPYRLFDPQTPEIADFSEEITEVIDLQKTEGVDQEITTTFSYSVTKLDLIGGPYKTPSTTIWAADKVQFEIDLTTQPSRLQQTTKITPKEGRVTLAGASAWENGVFNIMYDASPNSEEELNVESDTTVSFILDKVYSSNASSLSDSAAGQPSWFAQVFGEPLIHKPAWGNKFSSDFHNIGKTQVEEVLRESLLYDPLTMGQPTASAPLTITPSVQKPEVYHDFKTDWGTDLANDPDDHFIAVSSVRQNPGHDCEGNVNGTALDIEIEQSDILQSETTTFSFTCPRSTEIRNFNYTWSTISDGYSEPAAKVLLIGENNPKPFIEALTDPATYITAKTLGEELEVTNYNYDVLLTPDAAVTVLVPPPSQTENTVTEFRAGPGYLATTADTTYTPSFSETATITVGPAQAIAQDIGAFSVTPPAGSVGGGIYDHLVIDSFTQQGDVDTGTTDVAVSGFWHEFDGSTSQSVPATSNYTEANQEGYTFTSANNSQQISFQEDMANPDILVVDVYDFVPDFSTAAIDHATLSLPPSTPIISTSGSSFNPGSTQFTVSNARTPVSLHRNITTADIDEYTTFFGLGLGPIAPVGIKDGGTGNDVYTFSSPSGAVGQASVKIKINNLGTHPVSGDSWTQVLLDMGAVAGSVLGLSFDTANLLNTHIPITENATGYYIDFPGWSFGPWGSNTITRKLHEGKVMLPIEMFFSGSSPGDYSGMPDWWMTEYNASSDNVVLELEVPVEYVEIDCLYTYSEDIPFSVNYKKTVETSLSTEFQLVDSTLYGLIDLTQANITVTPSNALNDNVVIAWSDESTNTISVSGLHPGVDSTINGTFKYRRTAAVSLSLHYTTVASSTWEDELWLDLGVKPSIEFDICASNNFVLKETTNNATIDICNNGFGITYTGPDNTIAPPGTAVGNYWIHIENIPSLVLVQEELGWIGQAWQWVTGAPAPNAPTGDLEATASYAVLDGTPDAAGDITGLSVELTYDYPADLNTGAYLGDGFVSQVKSLGEDITVPFIYAYDYNSATSGNEVRLVVPQGTADNDYSQNFITSTNHPNASNFIVQDKSNYSSIMNDKKLTFEVSGLPIQSEPVQWDVLYEYQLAQFPMEVSYIRKGASVYPDLNVEFDYSFIAEVPIFAILDSAGNPVNPSNSPGSYDSITSVYFIDKTKNAGTCSGDCTWDSACKCPVTEMSDVTDATNLTALSGNALYFKDSRNNLIFPTGIHPSDTSNYSEALHSSGDYSVEVKYKYLNNYIPPSEYSDAGYILTALLGNVGPQYELALDIENKRINYNTDDGLDTDDIQLCTETLGGVFGSSTSPGEEYAGECVDSNGDVANFETKTRCEEVGLIWILDSVTNGYCDQVDIDNLIENDILVKFGFWIIGPNDDSSGLKEVYKHQTRYGTLDECWKEMISEYTDRFPVQTP